MGERMQATSLSAYAAPLMTEQRVQAMMGMTGALSEAPHATTALRWMQTWGSSSACMCARQGHAAHHKPDLQSPTCCWHSSGRAWTLAARHATLCINP